MTPTTVRRPRPLDRPAPAARAALDWLKVPDSRRPSHPTFNSAV